MQRKPSDYEIVYPQQKDLLALGKMMAASWREAYPNKEHGVSREWVESQVASWYDPPMRQKWHDALQGLIRHDTHFLYRIAVRPSGEVIGMLSGVKFDRAQELRNLYISKKYYGSGLASELLQCYLDWVNPAYPVTLDVASYNARAIAFYRKFGFEPTTHPPKLLHNTVPIITMRREAERKTNG